MRKRLGRLWHDINRLVEDVSRYIICFGLTKGILLFTVSSVWPSISRRAFMAPVPDSGVRLWVRPGTTDVNVFNDVFHGREHECTFSSPPLVILDAGAYTGLSAVYFAMHHPQAQVIALEPDTQNFALLKQNTSSFKNIQPINGALWKEKGALLLTDPGSGAWSLKVTEIEDSGAGQAGTSPDSSNGLKVQAFTVSDIMRNCGVDQIDLLKLDIEGSEKEVFSESDPWIRQVSAISIELHDRFKPGCSRAFYNAVSDFPIELRRGEKVLVARDDSLVVAI